MTIYRETITWPPVRETQILARVTGAEVRKTAILSSHANVAPTEAVSISPENNATQTQKVYRAGMILVKMTKNVGGGEDELGKWGPFDQGASDDGRDAQISAFKQNGAANAIMRFTAKQPGMIGRQISVAVVDNAGVSDALVVTVTEQSDGTTDISVQLETGADTVEVSTAAEVIAAVNADAGASKIAQAANGGSSDGTGLAAAFAAAFLTGDRPDVEVGVLSTDVNVHLGEVAAAIYTGHAVFRKSNLQLYANNEADLDAALGAQFSKVEDVTDLA